MTIRSLIVGSIAILATAVSVDAASINIGNIQLLENTPDQIFAIHVTGGDQVAGLTFWAQVGEGPAAFGGADGPDITYVDIIGPGTIFFGNNTGENGDPTAQVLGEYYEAVTTTGSGTVAAEGVLAYVTMDTTGFFAGRVFDFKLADTLTGDTDWGGTPIDITNGTITLTAIPEPASLGLVGIAGLGLLARRRRLA